MGLESKVHQDFPLAEFNSEVKKFGAQTPHAECEDGASRVKLP